MAIKVAKNSEIVVLALEYEAIEREVKAMAVRASAVKRRLWNAIELAHPETAEGDWTIEGHLGEGDLTLRQED